VITRKTFNSAPQYTLRVKKWKTDVATGPGAFAFTPPAGAQPLNRHDLIELDELPPSAPEGGMR